MKILFILLLGLVSLSTIANEAKVEINPVKPVAGEMFQAFFRIYTEYDGEPDINFSTYKVEVVGKSNQGVTTRTIYKDGQISTTREITIVYDLSAPEAGAAGLRDITIGLGDKKIRHPAMNFNVLGEPEQLGDIFLMTDVTKKSAFLGEGIVVRYYLYSKVPVNNLDVKKYPKLNGFLKRFLQEPERSERVSVDGQVYLRTQIYAAKLFPEKIGELKIDPMYMSATVLVSRGGDPFGNFGFGREMKTRSLSSEVVKIEIKPLPEKDKPVHFTGLVGKHDFDLKVSQTKLIVNEPIELKLTVSGGGALENLEAPVILSNPSFEEFETNGDLKIVNAEEAIKTFEYTFLAKKNLDLPSDQVTLSYFDPDQMKYIAVPLAMPQLTIAGGNSEARSSESTETKPKEDTVNRSTPEKPLELPLPMLRLNNLEWKLWLQYINTFLAFTALIIALGISVKRSMFPTFSKSHIPSDFKRGQFSLNEFANWLNPLILKSGKSLNGLIKDSHLSPQSKTYFIDLLNSNDYKDYSVSKGQMSFTYKSEHFKELDKYIQSIKNEDITEPS